MDLAKMEIEARRELAQFEAEMRVQATKLSQAWELEKMQRASELDFQVEEQKLQAKHEAVLKKEIKEKEKYAAYVERIEADENLSDKEKAQFKRMGYDRMVAGIKASDRLYFPERFQDEAPFDLTGGAGAEVEAAPAETDRMLSAVNRARGAMPGASPEEIADRAEQIVLDELKEENIPLISQRAGGQLSQEAVEAQAEVEAQRQLIDLKVQQGLSRSAAGGYKPTAYQTWEKFVKERLGPTARRAATRYYGRALPIGNPEYFKQMNTPPKTGVQAQMNADKARVKSRSRYRDYAELVEAGRGVLEKPLLKRRRK
jgi:hypothetical protein